MTLKWRDIETIDEVEELEPVLLKFYLILDKYGYHSATMLRGSKGKYFTLQGAGKVHPYVIKKDYIEWAYIEEESK